MLDLFTELELILRSLERRSPNEGAKYMRQHIENAADFGADLRALAAKPAQK
jgi:DNA-binding GntR family transcriptional regulator